METLTTLIVAVSRAHQKELDKLRAINAELLAALKDLNAKIEEQLCGLIDEADRALNSDCNDDEHDALCNIRESLFEIVVNAKREAFRGVHMRDNKADLIK